MREPDDWAVIYALGFVFAIGFVESKFGLSYSGILLFFGAFGCSTIGPNRSTLIWLILSSAIPLTHVLAGLFNFSTTSQPSWLVLLLLPIAVSFIGTLFGAGYALFREAARDF